MFGRGQHPALTEEFVGVCPPLKTFHHGFAVVVKDFRIFGVGLIGAAPAIVPGHGQGRREVPVQPRDGNFPGGNRANFADQVRIAGGPETDVMGEESSALDVVVTVYGIGGPDNGNGGKTIAIVHGRLIETVRQSQPVVGRGILVTAGEGTAAVENRAQVVALDVFRRHIAQFRLDHLAHFLFDGHASQQRINLRLVRHRIGQGRRMLRP